MDRRTEKMLNKAFDTIAKLAARPASSEGTHVHLPESMVAKLEANTPEIKIDVHVPEQKPPVIHITTPTQEPPKVDVTVEAQPAPIIQPKIDVHVPKQEAPKVEVVNKLEWPQERTETMTIERGRGNLITKIKKRIGFK